LQCGANEQIDTTVCFAVAMSFPEKKIALKDEEQCHRDEEQCYHVYRKAQGESYWIDN
jgi:hypothetical protein